MQDNWGGAPPATMADDDAIRVREADRCCGDGTVRGSEGATVGEAVAKRSSAPPTMRAYASSWVVGRRWTLSQQLDKPNRGQCYGAKRRHSEEYGLEDKILLMKPATSHPNTH